MLKTLLTILSVYFVTFTDKPIPASTPAALGERALIQRTDNHIELDSLDYPVSTVYLNRLSEAGAEVMHTSRWFNGATVYIGDDETLSTLRTLDCVRSIELTRSMVSPSHIIKHVPPFGDQPLSLPKASDKQLEQIGLTELHRQGYNGQGMLVAIMDGGFANANHLPWATERVIAHYDLTDDEDNFFGSTGNHGTMCLSLIGGDMTDYSGAAKGAEFVLFRTEEYVTESPKEMDNLVTALELADSLGVNIASISLGYYDFDDNSMDLTYSMMNGRSTRASLAATIAARKGMLVCVAAGNEANKPWHYIDVPADADSILTVGAVDSLGHITAFSSRGPSADGRIKPEVCAMGGQAAIIHPSGVVQRGNGTSFACPLIAGMAATLWSALPDANAMEIRDRIIRSASQYSTPDGTYGYGIANAYAAYQGTTALPSISPAAIAQPVAEKHLSGSTLIIIRNGNTYSLTGALLSPSVR